MAKVYDAGVKEYRENYWMPDYSWDKSQYMQ
jgi:hypothetical protein